MELMRRSTEEKIAEGGQGMVISLGWLLNWYESLVVTKSLPLSSPAFPSLFSLSLPPSLPSAPPSIAVPT